MSKDFLSQDEVDSLLEGVPASEDAPAEKPAEASGTQPYDFASGQRIVRGGLPALELVNERFAQSLGKGLKNFVCRNVDVVAGPLRFIKYSEFIRALLPPLYINLVQVKPLHGTALFVFDPGLISLVVDNIFGGSGQLHTRNEGTGFTPTEQRVIRRLLDIVLKEMQKSWETLHKVEFEYIQSEARTQFIDVAAPNDTMMTITYSVDFGTGGGAFHICMPYSMLEPIRESLSHTVKENKVAIEKRWVQRLSKQVQSAEVELVVNLGRAELTFEQLLSMKTGDVISLEIPQPMTAEIDGVPVMECRCGIFNGQYALKVEQVLSGQIREN